MAATINKSDIIHKLAETIGMEKAAQVVEEAVLAAGYKDKDDYLQEEVLKVYRILMEKGGIIKIVAGFLAAEAHLMNT